jgi:D-aminoacyl-tRNA deacylase
VTLDRSRKDARGAPSVIGLLQRVSKAQVLVAGQPVAAIGTGLLVLVGVERHDTETVASRLLERIVTYRVFPDESGRMNRDLLEQRGALLLVPQFTLAADTAKGRRPGFSSAASPENGRHLFEYLVAQAKQRGVPAGSGQFGATMQVHLINEGPVTFWLQVEP